MWADWLAIFLENFCKKCGKASVKIEGNNRLSPKSCITHYRDSYQIAVWSTTPVVTIQKSIFEKLFFQGWQLIYEIKNHANVIVVSQSIISHSIVIVTSVILHTHNDRKSAHLGILSSLVSIFSWGYPLTTTMATGQYCGSDRRWRCVHWIGALHFLTRSAVW